RKSFCNAKNERLFWSIAILSASRTDSSCREAVRPGGSRPPGKTFKDRESFGGFSRNRRLRRRNCGPARRVAPNPAARISLRFLPHQGLGQNEIRSLRADIFPLRLLR